MEKRLTSGMEHSPRALFRLRVRQWGRPRALS